MLKEILSISGKPGLQKLISNSSNAIIVESLIDGKRFPAYSNSKIIALEDISIYTEAEDMPLKEVFKRISAKENGKSALSHKEPTEKILAYFEEIVPEYDKERVYVSDMKKIIQWYNLLTEKGMLDLDEEAKEEEKKENEKKKKEKSELDIANAEAFQLAKELSKEHNTEVAAICKKYTTNGNPKTIKNIEDTKSLIEELKKLK